MPTPDPKTYHWHAPGPEKRACADLLGRFLATLPPAAFVFVAQQWEEADVETLYLQVHHAAHLLAADSGNRKAQALLRKGQVKQ